MDPFSTNRNSQIGIRGERKPGEEICLSTVANVTGSNFDHFVHIEHRIMHDLSVQRI